MNYIQPNKKIEKGIWIFTIVVFLLVVILHELPKGENDITFLKILPKVNAFINGTCFVLLISSLIAVNQKLNTTAMILSVVFLLSYVANHTFNPETKYKGDLDFKGIYIFILATHIILAAVSLPMILFAYYRAWTGNIEGHRKLVRTTYPIWLYVTLTGVLVYLFLAP
jgi:putative membrane protein